MEKYNYKVNSLSSYEYAYLHSQCGFRSYDAHDIDEALMHSLFTIGVYDDEHIIGMGRVVGDGKLAFFLKDIMVLESYQSQHIGRKIMDEIFNYLDSVACEGSYIGLMSTPGKEFFYKKFGFIERPSEGLGSGMVLFYEK